MNIYSLRGWRAGCEEKANRRASPSTHWTPYGRVHHGVPNVRSSPRVHGSGHRALAQGGDGCPAPLPRVAVRPFRTPFRDRRQEMCGQMRHTILADRRLFGRPSGGSSLKSAAGGPGMPAPPSVSPPLEPPPFPDPPSKLESTKGGETAGGTGTAAVMARLKKPRGPSPPAEPRAAALPPTRVRYGGRVGFPDPLRRLSPL
jgi:hypothetical protein